MVIELLQLRPHQVKAIDSLKNAIISGKKRPMIQAPCGSGKTVIAAKIVSGALSKSKRVCFCVPFITLIDQTFTRFVENGIQPDDMGIIQASHPWTRPHAPVQIASIQTLRNREYPDVNIVIVDEGHVRSKVINAWANARPDILFIFLSATPWSRGLGRLCDSLIKVISMKELIDQGYLSRYVAFAPSKPDLSKVKTLGDDYREDQLSEVMSHPKIIADVVCTWLEKGRGLPTLCFAVNRNHAQKLTHEFEKSGVRVAYVDAFTNREERAEIQRKFASGEIEIVINIGVLTAGVDWDVRCVILARPTKSRILFIQIIGRGLRTAKGKDHCLILDHTSTMSEIIGMPETVDQDFLCNGIPEDKQKVKEREKSLPLPRICKSCSFLMPPGEQFCSQCGNHQIGRTGVVQVEGELVELSSRRREKTKSVKDRLRDLGRETVWAMLKTVEIRQGWKDGAAAHKYREIFDVWPRGISQTTRLEPCSDLLSWIRSRQIAFARGRERRAS